MSQNQTEKITSQLMIDIAGYELTSEDKDLLHHQQISGLILFSRNMKSPQQVKHLCDQVRSINPDILIAVDQEGGRVQRIKEGVTVLPSMKNLVEYAKRVNDNRLIKDTGWLMASEMLSLGLDISFAPVLDIDRNNSQIVGDRSFGNKVSEIIQYGGEFIDGMHEAGMAVTGKHFPGHGGVTGDSHEVLPVDNRSVEVMEEDAQIFKELAPRLDGVMPAHILYTHYDNINPAGFSSYWIQKVLRTEFQFSGCVFSDDLSMQGAQASGDIQEIAKKALLAGCNMLILCNNREKVVSLLNFFRTSGLSSPSESVLINKMKFKGKRISLDSLRNSNRWKKVHHVLESIPS